MHARLAPVLLATAAIAALAGCGADAGPVAAADPATPPHDRAQLEAWYRSRPVPPGPATFEPAGGVRRTVATDHGAIAVREWPGAEPAVVMAHGFPDDHHLYDRVVPLLAGRHVVVFDWLGWGESDTPADYRYDAANQARELDAVVSGLGLDTVALVVHDSSGPPGIDWALAHMDGMQQMCTRRELRDALEAVYTANEYLRAVGEIEERLDRAGS